MTLQEDHHILIGIRVSRATMGRITLKLNYSVKKTLHAAEKESDRVQRKRVEFWQKIRDIPAKDLISAIIDSMSKVTKSDIRNWFAHCCYCTS